MAKTEAPKRGKFAFQCRHCGAVEPKEAAGDNKIPVACHICRTTEPENWIILADLSDAELKKGFPIHGLTRDNIEGHKSNPAPKASGKAVTHHKRTATERVGSRDRG